MARAGCCMSRMVASWTLMPEMVFRNEKIFRFGFMLKFLMVRMRSR